MPSKRNATKKGRLNGATCKELNMNASKAVVERTIVGTNEDTVFGRITKMWGNGHCRALVQWNGVKAELNKVRIPKNRLGKKGSTPINMSSVVSIFVGKDFDASNLRDTDQFDITSIIDDKQVLYMIKQELVPTWFMKTADELSSGLVLGPVGDDEAWEWDDSSDETLDGAQSSLKGGLSSSVALTKKQLREVKKAANKITSKTTTANVPAVETDDSDDEDGIDLFNTSTKPIIEKKIVEDDSKWASIGAARSWIDRI